MTTTKLLIDKEHAEIFYKCCSAMGIKVVNVTEYYDDVHLLYEVHSDIGAQGLFYLGRHMQITIEQERSN